MPTMKIGVGPESAESAGRRRHAGEDRDQLCRIPLALRRGRSARPSARACSPISAFARWYAANASSIRSSASRQSPSEYDAVMRSTCLVCGRLGDGLQRRQVCSRQSIVQEVGQRLERGCIARVRVERAAAVRAGGVEVAFPHPQDGRARKHGGVLRVELLGLRERSLGGVEVERVQAHAAIDGEPFGAATAELERALVALHREPRIAALQLRLRERAPGRRILGRSSSARRRLRAPARPSRRPLRAGPPAGGRSRCCPARAPRRRRGCARRRRGGRCRRSPARA